VSCPAQAGHPVRRGISIHHQSLGVLDRPVEPGDDSVCVVIAMTVWRKRAQ